MTLTLHLLGYLGTDRSTAHSYLVILSTEESKLPLLKLGIHISVNLVAYLVLVA